MLPDADDFPSPAPELAGDAFISGHVVLTLFIPELAVGFGAGVALGAAVPAASAAQRRNVKSQDVTPLSCPRRASSVLSFRRLLMRHMTTNRRAGVRKSLTAPTIYIANISQYAPWLESGIPGTLRPWTHLPQLACVYG